MLCYLYEISYADVGIVAETTVGKNGSRGCEKTSAGLLGRGGEGDGPHVRARFRQ